MRSLAAIAALSLASCAVASTDVDGYGHGGQSSVSQELLRSDGGVLFNQPIIVSGSADPESLPFALPTAETVAPGECTTEHSVLVKTGPLEGITHLRIEGTAAVYHIGGAGALKLADALTGKSMPSTVYLTSSGASGSVISFSSFYELPSNDAVHLCLRNISQSRYMVVTELYQIAVSRI